jgi:ubiquinone/menaquinone biosynthesis C-methylase UbiE
MNFQKIYEKQYQEKKLNSNYASFPILRKIFKKFDISRENLAISFLEKGERLLDIGCGEGRLLAKAKDNYKELYGIDIVEARIEQAKKFFQENDLKDRVYLSIKDVNEGLPFEDEFFDTVTMIAVLEHLFDPFFIIKEINRVLKRRGLLILETPNIAYIKQRIKLLFGKLPITSSPYNWSEIGWDGGHLHYFTKETLCRLLKESDFKIIKISGSGLFAKFRNWWPSLLNGDLVVKAQKILK